MDQRVSRITSGDTTYEVPHCYKCGGEPRIVKVGVDSCVYFVKCSRCGEKSGTWKGLSNAVREWEELKNGL